MASPAPARKRSRWELDDAPDDAGSSSSAAAADDEAALERARGEAARKASRARVKAAKRAAAAAAAAATAAAAAPAAGSSTPTGSSSAAGPSSPRTVPASEASPAGSPPPGPPAPRPPAAPRPAVPPRSAHPLILGARPVSAYERLNHIDEGAYGVVWRARDIRTGDVVALKKLKMDKEKNGFPVTSLREIRTALEGRHEHVVRVREIVVGETLSQIYICMDFIEHDLKALLNAMRAPFLASETKTLLQQLLSAIAHLHARWIIHRDLKTSNLLMNNRGQLKLADFGLARMYGEPARDMTQLVVTLWYRAPELLLGAERYDQAIDMWSVGCIFAELITKEPLFPGKNETDQMMKVFKLLGQPSDEVWPGFSKLPGAKSMSNVAQPFSSLRTKLRYSTEQTLDLLSKLLTYDPSQRISAEEALRHPYFDESPRPAHPDTFSSFPSVAAGERKRNASPDAPERLADQKLAYQLELDI